MAYQNTFSLIPQETLLGLEDQFQSDTRIEALYRRYKNRHYNKEKSRRIGIHANEVDHSFLVDDNNEFNLGSGGEISLDVLHEMGQQYAISIRQAFSLVE